ncbi:hypothetical protein ACVWZD_000506, partial [Streptomyces sp. TE3672]
PAQGAAAQVVIVGDPNQAIYAFRGAENALEDWPADIELPLNKSWRFGPEVADIANVFLKLLGSPYLMEGNDAVSTPIGPIETPNAVLGRNNTGVVAAVLDALEEGRAVHMVGGGDELQRMAEGALELQEKGKTRKHPELVPFRSWQQVQRYIDKHDSAKQLKSFVRLVDEHGADTLIDMVGQLTENADEADLIVSTAHKSKGLEWRLVQIGTDFRGPKTSTDPGQPVELPEDEELRLAYVAATRGMRGLDLGSLQYIEDLRVLAEERHASRGAAMTDGAPSPTPQTPAAPDTPADPAVGAPQPEATEPTPSAEGPTPAPVVPERSAFEVLKPREASALAAANGTLWWGGKAASRKNSIKEPVLVRLQFGRNGVVDVEEVATGKNIERIRTGTPLFAAPATPTPQAEPPQTRAVRHEAAPEPVAESAPGARGDVSGTAPEVTPEAEPAATTVQPPAVNDTPFKVRARATDTGRRWAVLDHTTGDVVWIRRQGEAPLEALFADKEEAERTRDSLTLAPELRVPAPEPSTAQVQPHRPGPALAPVLGTVIAKESRGTDQLVKVQVDDGTGTQIYVAWNPVGGDQVQVQQTVYLSGTVGAKRPFNGRIETTVEGGTVEGEAARHDRHNRTQPAPQGWTAADPSAQPDIEVGQTVRILDPHHPAHAATGQQVPQQLYSTVTVELADADSYAGTSADGRVLVFTHSQVVAVPGTAAPQPQQTTPAPAPAAEQDLAARDVSPSLLTKLRDDFSWAQRAGRWTIADLEPRPDGSRVEVLLRKNGEWAQAVEVGPHTLRDERGHFHGLDEVVAWRDATQLVTLLDRRERAPRPGAPAPVLVQERTPKPPHFFGSPQSMTGTALEACATALDQWLNAYAAQGDTGPSVRAVEARDALRAELEQRRQQQKDAEQLGGLDGFRRDLGDLIVEAADPSGIRGVMRKGARLGTVVGSAEGFHFVAEGQLALGEGTAYASPEGAAVALSRYLAGVPENQPLRKRSTKPVPAPAPRFVLTDEDKFVHTADGVLARTAEGKRIPTGADSNMLLKAHLSSVVRYKADPDQRSQQIYVERCRKHGRPEAGTHLSSAGRLAIITIKKECYAVRSPDRLIEVFGPWGENIKTRARANRIADALESIRDADGHPFPWDMESPTFRALQITAVHWRDQHGRDIRQAILHALVTQGLDERDGRYAKEYFEDTGERLQAPAFPTAPQPIPEQTDPSIPGRDAFQTTIVKKVLGEVAAADGTFWWKGEANNLQVTQLRSKLEPILVRIEESADEKGASIGWARVLDAATGNQIQNIRSTSHVLVATPLTPATPAGDTVPAQRRFASLGQVRTHLMAAKIPGLSPGRRTDVRTLAKDRELVELTDDGQFAIRKTDETFEILPAGSGLPFDGLLPDLYLTPAAARDLAVTPQPLEGLPSLEDAHTFAGRLTELRTTSGELIDWSDPQLGTRLSSADFVHLNHTILEERAHHDRANENANSPSDAMWQLFEDQPQRPDPSTDTPERWADTLSPGDWVWLRINDENRAWEVVERADTELGTVTITLDDDSTWHLPRNLSVRLPDDRIVTAADGNPIGLRLAADFVLDDDVIEFDLDPEGVPLAPTGDAGIAAPGTIRIRGRARVTHQHPHGGGERTYLLDATIVNGEDIEPAPVKLTATAFELPEHVYRLSLRAPLADQEAQPQPPSLARPATASRQEPNFEFVEDLGIRFPIVFANELQLAAELKAEMEADSAPDVDIEAELAATLELAAELEADLAAADELGTDPDLEPEEEPDPVAEDDPEFETENELDPANEADAEPHQEQAPEPQEEARPQNVTALPPRLPEGEELRLSLLRLLNAPDAPTTPAEHTVLDDAPLYARVAHSPRHGRVVQFGFDPTSPRAAAQFTAADLEGATGEEVLRGVLARRPQPQPIPVDPAPLTPDRLREDLLQLMDNPAAPSVPTLQRKMSALDLYVAVTGHPEHGSVLRFGFDATSAPAGLFTRSDLQGATSDKVVQIVEHYGEAFVQGRIDTDRARRVRDRVQAAARERQLPQPPSPAGPSGPIRHPRPDEHGRRPSPTASPSR